MRLRDATAAETAALQPDAREQAVLRHAAERFDRKLADTLPMVHELARQDRQFWQVARSITAAMVNVQLIIAVLGGGTVVSLAVFDGAVVEPRSNDARPASGPEEEKDDRDRWERVFALRRSAASFSGRLNRCRFFAMPSGLTATQYRVATAGVLAVGRLIETIGSLGIPDEYYELAR
jgi:hypothetical protein